MAMQRVCDRPHGAVIPENSDYLLLKNADDHEIHLCANCAEAFNNFMLDKKEDNTTAAQPEVAAAPVQQPQVISTATGQPVQPVVQPTAAQPTQQQ